MASRSVELAVFWLPLLAGILLSGIAGSAWYGGDKIPAIWIAFFGVVCLLLTAALQIQNFAYANLLQPEIDIEAPTQRTILTWNLPTSFFINSRPENKAPPGRDSSESPAIIFENRSNVIGQDASNVAPAQLNQRVDTIWRIAGASALKIGREGAHLIFQHREPANVVNLHLGNVRRERWLVLA